MGDEKVTNCSPDREDKDEARNFFFKHKAEGFQMIAQ